MALTYKCIDTMKASRDSNTWTNQQKIDHINAIVQFVPDITHITICCYSNNTGYQSYAYVREWCDAIHNAGKKVWFRMAFIGTDASSTLEEIYTAIMEGPIANPNWFATGDLFELQAETNPYIGELVGDAASEAEWNAWIRDKIVAAEAVFAGMGKTISCKIVSITDGFLRQGIWEAATVTAMGNQVSYDSYPLDALTVSPERNVITLINDIRTMHGLYPDADIILSEIGYRNTGSISDEKQREMLRLAFNAISNFSYVKGINYWVSYNTTGGGGFTQLFQTNSLTLPRPALRSLNEYYTKGYCRDRVEII